jgi:hypothetical protein
VGLPRLTQRQVAAGRIAGHGLMWANTLRRCETGQAHVSTSETMMCKMLIASEAMMCKL